MICESVGDIIVLCLIVDWLERVGGEGGRIR